MDQEQGYDWDDVHGAGILGQEQDTGTWEGAVS